MVDINEALFREQYTANRPHASSEEWRSTGYFTRWNRFKNGFPGLGIATVAFAAYCGYEYLFLKDDHGHGHGDVSKDTPTSKVL